MERGAWRALHCRSTWLQLRASEMRDEAESGLEPAEVWLALDDVSPLCVEVRNKKERPRTRISFDGRYIFASSFPALFRTSDADGNLFCFCFLLFFKF